MCGIVYNPDQSSLPFWKRGKIRDFFIRPSVSLHATECHTPYARAHAHLRRWITLGWTCSTWHRWPTTEGTSPRRKVSSIMAFRYAEVAPHHVSKFSLHTRWRWSPPDAPRISVHLTYGGHTVFHKKDSTFDLHTRHRCSSMHPIVGRLPTMFTDHHHRRRRLILGTDSFPTLDSSLSSMSACLFDLDGHGKLGEVALSTPRWNIITLLVSVAHIVRNDLELHVMVKLHRPTSSTMVEQ